MPKQQRKEVNYFQLEEITAIRDALESEPVKWRTMTHLLLVGGMRRGGGAAGVEMEQSGLDREQDTYLQ